MGEYQKVGCKYHSVAHFPVAPLRRPSGIGCPPTSQRHAAEHTVSRGSEACTGPCRVNFYVLSGFFFSVAIGLRLDIDWF